ncbi:MAG: cupin domain-containing protein [Bacteroidetes bacterium]|nr:cupin domain-containing protein [Bacteroidota bacterium]
MNPILKNVLAVLAGLIGGSIVNMSIIMISGSVIPPPAGADVTTEEGLKASMHLFEAKHFIMPFLAHALGTLAGAFLAALIAATHKAKFALAIGFVFLAGGIANVMMLPSPLWFTVVDLGFAYLPMAFIGGRLGMRKINCPSIGRWNFKQPVDIYKLIIKEIYFNQIDMNKEILKINKNGETLIITGSSIESKGTITTFEGMEEPGIGPPMHVHFKQEEMVKVIKGKMRIKTLTKEFSLLPGEEYIFLPGEAHQFWNEGDDLLHYAGHVKPSHNYEYFIRQLYRSCNEANDDKPNPFDGAFLLTV